MFILEYNPVELDFKMLIFCKKRLVKHSWSRHYEDSTLHFTNKWDKDQIHLMYPKQFE